MKQTLPKRPIFTQNNPDNHFPKKYRKDFATMTDAELIYVLRRNKLKPNRRIVSELLSRMRKSVAGVGE